MLILAALVFTLFTAAYFVLQNEQLQSKVVRKVTKEIEARTGADVHLDRIDWNFPNAFIINQFYGSARLRVFRPFSIIMCFNTFF